MVRKNRNRRPKHAEEPHDDRPSWEVRLDRASEHLQATDTAIKRWLKKKPYTLSDELDANTAQHVLFINPERPPLAISALVSDCLHNLRAALDNLAYGLAEANLGTALPADVANGSEFPIFWDGPIPPRKRKQKIGGIDAQAANIIDNLQPHLRGDHFKSDPLWVIHELDRVNKHRAIQLIPSVIRGAALNGPFTITGGAMIGPDYGGQVRPLEGKTEWLRYGGTLNLGNPKRKIEDQFNVTLDVAFPDSSPAANGELVVPTLNVLRDYVRDEVFAPLASFL